MLFYHTSYDKESYITVEAESAHKARKFMTLNFEDKWYQQMTHDQFQLHGQAYTKLIKHYNIS